MNPQEQLIVARIRFLRAKKAYREAVKAVERELGRREFERTLPAVLRKQAG